MTVVHVRVGFRPGLPEVSSRNKLFAAIKLSSQHQQLFQGAAGAIHPALGPEPDDIVVTKHRVNAFTGTDLEMVLRAREVETIVLFGIATSGVVLSTLLHACDVDFKLVVIADCCADLDPDLHAVLLNRLFPQRAEVLTAAEFVNALQSSIRNIVSVDTSSISTTQGITTARKRKRGPARAALSPIEARLCAPKKTRDHGSSAPSAQWRALGATIAITTGIRCT
jgi:nicotinamidase-related amidase